MTFFFLEEYSDFKEDGIYGYMAKLNNNLSLAALCNEAILIAGKVDDLVTLLLYSSRRYNSTCVWHGNRRILTISTWLNWSCKTIFA